MFDLLAKGGVLTTPILLCSVVALAIFMERLIRLGSLRRKGLTVTERVVARLAQKDYEGARLEARRNPSPLGRVLGQGLEVADKDRETLETVLAHSIEEEARELSRYLQALATIANIAPLLGLLGTVLGMIKAFMAIQELGGKVNAAVLAGGIWEAMLTTALGLAVALPTMVAHSYLVGLVDLHEARLRGGAVSFLKSLALLRAA
ncbi:MAG: MotA/TolQ/ExbB proton channel family protein [Pseudomonadota bacterium]